MGNPCVEFYVGEVKPSRTPRPEPHGRKRRARELPIPIPGRDQSIGLVRDLGSVCPVTFVATSTLKNKKSIQKRYFSSLTLVSCSLTLHIYICIYIYVCMHIYIYIYTVYTYIYVCTYAYQRVSVSVCVCVVLGGYPVNATRRQRNAKAAAWRLQRVRAPKLRPRARGDEALICCSLGMPHVVCSFCVCVRFLLVRDGGKET